MALAEVPPSVVRKVQLLKLDVKLGLAPLGDLRHRVRSRAQSIGV